MSHFEEAAVRRFSGPRIVKWSIGLGVAGVLPLLLYIAFGPAKGNPIGLGLLAVVTVPIALLGIFVGAVKTLVHYVASGRR